MNRLIASLIAAFFSVILSCLLGYGLTDGKIVSIAFQHPDRAIFTLLLFAFYSGGVVALVWKD